MVELKEAIKIIKDNVIKINRTKKVNIVKSINKVSVEDIYAPIDNPPFDRSPYDGYTYNSNSENEKLKVIGVVYAGDVLKRKINKNEAVKIMTGGKIPEGANCVIKKEDVDIIGDMIIPNVKLNEYDNYVFKGEDIAKGQLIIRKNSIIGYEHIGILASVGIHEVTIYDDLRVGILNTGTEIQDIDEVLDDGKIYDSNKYILHSKLLNLGIDPITIDRSDDNILELKNKIKDIIKDVDILITTGGVSVGDKDLIPQVFKDIGAKELFWRVNIKPGGTCCVATLGNKVLFGLSGNPHATLIVFESILIPTLEYLTFKEKNHNIKAVFKGEFNKISKKDRFVNGRLFTKDTVLYVELTDDKDAKNRLYSKINSNCLIKVEKNNTIEDNQEVDILLI